MGSKWSITYRKLLIIPALAFFSTLGYTQDQSFTVRDFSLGFIDKQDAAEIPDGAAQSIQNIDIWSGKPELRRGSLKQNSSAINGASSAVQLIHEFIDNDDTFHMLFAINGTIFRSSNGGASSTVLASSYGFTSASVIHAVSAFGTARLTDGTTHWLVYDGTTVSQDTISVRGRLAEFYAERVWTADRTSERSTLFASRFQDVTDWTINDDDDGESLSENVLEDDGYPIRALKRYRDTLYVFKDNSFHAVQVLSDGLTFVVTPISTIVGTVYPRSIQITPKGMIFLHTDGFYLFDGVQLVKISDPIHNTFFDIRQLDRGEDSWTVTNSAEFSSGTITTTLSTSTVAGDVTFATATIIDNFDDGDFTNNPTWTQHRQTLTQLPDTEQIVSGHFNINFSVVTATIAYVRQSSMSVSSAFNEGIWSVRLRSDIAPSCGGTTDSQHGIGFAVGETTSAFSSPTTTRFSPASNSAGLRAIAFQACPDAVALWSNDTRIQIATTSINLFDGTFHTINLFYHKGLDDATVSIDGTQVLQEVSMGLTGAQAFAARAAIMINPPNQLNFRFDDVQMSPVRGIYQSEPHDMSADATAWDTFETDTSESNGSIVFGIYSDTDTNITTSNTSTFISSQAISNGQIPTINYTFSSNKIAYDCFICGWIIKVKFF